VRAADLAPPRRAESPSLMSILGLLVALLIADFLIHWRLAHVAWLPLTAKVVFTAVGVAAVVGWLQRVTRGDAPAARALFLRRFAVCCALAVSINLTWHFLRAWLPLFLRTVHDYSLEGMNVFSMGYYLAAWVGSLAAGVATLRLARAGLSVHASRVAVVAACAAAATLCAVVPFLATGPLLVGVLLVIGCAALGLFPPYYSLTQELTPEHQGKVSGALGCINWLVMALMQEAVGERVRATRSYTEVIPAAGFVPLLGLAALLLFWGRSAAPAPAPAAKGAPSSDGVAGPATEVVSGAPDTEPAREGAPERVG
jgi:hypothetical protein